MLLLAFRFGVVCIRASCEGDVQGSGSGVGVWRREGPGRIGGGKVGRQVGMGRTVAVPEDVTNEEEVEKVVEKEKEEINNAFYELLKQSGGCVATDGGFATQLEHHGADINDPLWSALCLITMPDLIRKVYFFFLSAVCDRILLVFFFSKLVVSSWIWRAC